MPISYTPPDVPWEEWPSTNTPVTAEWLTQVDDALTAIAAGDALPTGVVDVRAYGAVGDGSTDDTAAIQAAIDDTPFGGIVWFGRGAFVISNTLVLAPWRAYVGAGGRSMLTNISADSNLAGKPMLAAQGWVQNAGSADLPIIVKGLHLDGAGVTGCHGLVVYNFWSHVEDIQVGNLDGDDTWGILATDMGSNGETVTNNSHSENTFVRIRCYDFTNGASGFRAESNNGISNQDGHLTDSFFGNLDGYGINIGRAAGWTIENNHLYTIGYDAINLGNCYATKVIGNYIEDFGGQDASDPGPPTFGYYNGIALVSVLDTRASIVANNTVSSLQPDEPEGNRFACYYARAGADQEKANIVFVGNSAVFARNDYPGGDSGPAVKRTVGVVLGEDGDTDRMLYVRWSGNQFDQANLSWFQETSIVDFDTVHVIQDAPLDPDTFRIPEEYLPRRFGEISAGSGSGTVSLDFATIGNLINYTATGNVTFNAPSNPVDRAVIRFAVLASGDDRDVTFDNEYLLSSGLPSRTFTVPEDQVLLAAAEYSELAQAWVLTAATISES